jgi:hypothetical protein
MHLLLLSSGWMTPIFVVLPLPPVRTSSPTFTTVFVVNMEHRLTVGNEYVLRVFENELLRRKLKAVMKTVITCLALNVTKLSELWENRWAKRVTSIWKVTNT